MIFDDAIMQNVWKKEQDILDVIHKVCRENNLRYTLFYGTLLGAVRHGGFIPWDDDIDLVMPRADYEKLIIIWKSVAPPDYILQNQHTDKDYTNNFVKIRKNHTTFLQSEKEKNKKYHKGVFVDIFPADRAATNTILRKLQFVIAAIHLLYTRGYTSGNGGRTGVIEKIFLSVPIKLYPSLRDFTGKIIRCWNRCKNNEYVCFNTIEDCKLYFPADTFERFQSISFNGKYYCSVVNVDECLKITFGDYMKLPPEEDRVWHHHPLVIDFNKNYEELVHDATQLECDISC